MNKICFGCGIKLQSTDKEKLGYVPEKKLESSKYCMRCFKMNNYGVIKPEKVNKNNQDVINLMKDVQAKVKEKFDVQLEPEVRII